MALDMEVILGHRKAKCDAKFTLIEQALLGHSPLIADSYDLWWHINSQFSRHSSESQQNHKQTGDYVMPITKWHLYPMKARSRTAHYSSNSSLMHQTALCPLLSLRSYSLRRLWAGWIAAHICAQLNTHSTIFIEDIESSAFLLLLVSLLLRSSQHSQCSHVFQLADTL